MPDPQCTGPTFVFPSLIPVNLDSFGTASSVIGVFVPSGTICDVTVAFHARMDLGPREGGRSVAAQVLSPRSVHPLVDTSGLVGNRLGDSCESRIAFNDSALDIFPGSHPGDGSTGYADTFRTPYGPVFTGLRGLPAAHVNGAWQLMLQRTGTRDAGGTLVCWAVVVRTK